ncbi:MAG: hypothetical protein ACTS4W_00465 [Candidatus Hodgkinia cicadicola]
MSKRNIQRFKIERLLVKVCEICETINRKLFQFNVSKLMKVCPIIVLSF